jgi:hypothetical protein
MNWKQFVIAVIVGFIALWVMDYLVHELILGSAYEPFAGTVFRTEEDMMSKLWAMILGEIIFVLMFVWVYTYGVKGKGAMEGVRYGLYIGLMFSVVSGLGMWASTPITAWLAWMWIIFGVIETIILGLIVGSIYKTVRP